MLTFEDDPEGTGTPICRIRVPCHGYTDLGFALEIKCNNVAYFGYNMRTVIANSEMIVREYILIQRAEHSTAPFKIFRPYKHRIDSSFSSGTLNSGDDDILERHKSRNRQFRHLRPRDFVNKKKLEEKETLGSWLLLSYVIGGWTYSTTKEFMLKEFGVRCERVYKAIQTFSIQGRYKALVKFSTSEQLNEIVLSLRKLKITDKFIFLSFEKTLEENFDSDSSMDD